MSTKILIASTSTNATKAPAITTAATIKKTNTSSQVNETTIPLPLHNQIPADLALGANESDASACTRTSKAFKHNVLHRIRRHRRPYTKCKDYDTVTVPPNEYSTTSPPAYQEQSNTPESFASTSEPTSSSSRYTSSSSLSSASSTTTISAALAAALWHATNSISVAAASGAHSSHHHSALSPALSPNPAPHSMSLLDGSIAQQLEEASANATTTAAQYLHNAVASTAAAVNTTFFNDAGVGNGTAAEVEGDWLDDLGLIMKASAMLIIIIAAIFGNLLVIISVMRVRKLR